MSDVTQQDRLFTLQEVSAQCGLIPYIVRYWQGHFPELGTGPSKTQYSVNDVALLRRIKKLLYGEHLTIEQAKERLSRERAFPVQYPGGAAASAPASNPPEQPAPAAQAPAQAPVQAAEKPAASSDAAAEEARAALSALAEVRGELNAAREKAALGEQQREQWLQESQKLHEENVTLKDRVIGLETQLQGFNERVLKAEQDLEGERAAVAERDEQLKTASRQMIELNEQLAKERQTVRTQLEELAAAKARSVELESQLMQFSEQAGQSAEIFETLQKRNAELEQKLAFVTGQLKEIAGLFEKNSQ